jgi:hypothetical protein
MRTQSRHDVAERYEPQDFSETLKSSSKHPRLGTSHNVARACPAVWHIARVVSTDMSGGMKRTYSRSDEEGLAAPQPKVGQSLHERANERFGFGVGHHHRRSSSTMSNAPFGGLMSYQAPRRFAMWGALVCVACVLGLIARTALFGGIAYVAFGGQGLRDVLCDGVPPFVVVVDAGSTGCRAHAFRVTPGTVAPSFTLEPVAGARVKLDTPLASLAGKTQAEVAAVLAPMLTEIAKRVPTGDLKKTPVYVWATAGARALAETQQQLLWQTVTDVVRSETQFLLPPKQSLAEQNHFRTILGEEEGFFAWLAANYVSGVDVTTIGGTGTPLATQTVGALDVGGGSAQIVSLRTIGNGDGNGSGNGNMISATSLDELAERVYVRSYLGVGAAHAERRLRKETSAAALTQGKKEVSFPCGFKNELETVDGVSLIGTGEYDACVLLIQDLQYAKLREDGFGETTLRAPDDAIHNTQTFLGMSLLFHATHWLHVAFPGSLAGFPNSSLHEIAIAGRAACATEWTQIVTDKDGLDENTPLDRLPGRCFDTALIQSLLGLKSGFGFGEDTQKISFVDLVNGKDVEWTMGAALSLVHRARVHADGRDTALQCVALGVGKETKVAVGIGAKSRTGRTVRRWVGFTAAAGSVCALFAALAGAVEADKLWRLTKPAEREIRGLSMARKRGSLSNL